MDVAELHLQGSSYPSRWLSTACGSGAAHAIMGSRTTPLLNLASLGLTQVDEEGTLRG